jgi:hypothetical protein
MIIDGERSKNYNEAQVPASKAMKGSASSNERTIDDRETRKLSESMRGMV